MNQTAASRSVLTTYIPRIVVQFIKIYLTAILFFTLFRLILFLSELGRINSTVPVRDIFLSFIMGLRFDLVISGYILILPYTLLAFLSFFDRKFIIVKRVTFYFICIMFSFAFLVCAVDIPYFNQFFSRFSVTAFEWIDHPAFVLKMIIQEPRYWMVVVPFILFIFLFIRITRKIFHKITDNNPGNIYSKIVVSVLFLGLIFLGIRGRIEEKSPIKTGTAYFCNNAFLNQLGLNPSFTLVRSYLDSQKEENKTIKLIDDHLAIANVQKYLNIKDPDKNFPISRKVVPGDQQPAGYNVVVIIMESMSAAKMKRHGNKDNITPFLDSLSNQGYYFENAYSSGIHTFNGIFSTIFGFPAIFRQHPMKESSILKYHGLFSVLKENGYSTIYFTTHDGQFDNVEGFLKENDCETVISKPDYPSGMIKTTLGVPDDYMFEFSIPVLNDLNKKNKPFAAVYMTASDHGPWYIPDYFKPKNKEIRNQIVEYADYSLKKFIYLSSKEKWFRNTIFVFVADHGAPIDGTYDMSIDYNHMPMLFYSPAILSEPRVSSSMAGQLDVFPSLMDLLKIKYTNNTLGIDLFTESRPYIFCNADDKYGVFDNDWFLIVRNDNSMSLYKYREKDLHNYAAEKPGIADKMNLYAQSNLQAFQYILTNRKQ